MTTGSMNDMTHELVGNVVIMNLASGSYGSLGDRLQKLYQKWYKLEDEERARVNSRTTCNMQADLKIVYNALVEAFIEWDNIQKMEGAPGCDCKDNLRSFDDIDIQNQLSRVMGDLEKSMGCKTTNNVKNEESVYTAEPFFKKNV